MGYGNGGAFMSQITKRALGASLKNMLLQKPLNKITINDIAEDCGISRMTFYYHFKDIYDLVEWVCVEDARQALAGKKTYDTWQEGFQNIFYAVQENKPFIMNVYRSVSRRQTEQYLNPLIHSLLLDVVEEKAAGLSISPESKQFIASFYEYAFIGVMLEWIDGNMKEDPAEIVANVSKVVQGNLVRALNAFSTNPSLHSPRND